jgi:O-antigen/teichoic acid export membrane protein
VPILQVLCLAGLLHPIHAVNLHALMAQGHARLMFRLELVKKAVGVTLLVAGAWFGVMGVAWSQVVFSLAVLAVNTHYTKRWLGYGAWAQLREIGPSMVAAGLVAFAVHLLSQAWHAPALLKLAVLGAAGALAYLSIIIATRMNATKDVMTLLSRSKKAPVP